jgi:ABC-type sugar transport system permease subunit
VAAAGVNLPTDRRGTKARPSRRARGHSLTPYLFVAPAVLVLGLVFAYAVVRLFVQSVSSPGLMGETEYGLQNFSAVLSDPLFHSAVLNNLRLFLAVPVLTVVAVLLAALLFERVRGWRFYSSVIFVPYVLAVTVVGIIFSYILQRHGLLNQVLSSLHLSSLTRDWLGDSGLAIWSIWAVVVWQQLGFGVVLFLARLSSIDVTLYEAATLDRAGWWQIFRHITVPHLAPVIEFFVTISLINMLSWIFNYVYVMTGGGPVLSTYVLELLIYQTAFRDGLPNLAAALSVVVLVFAIVLLSVQSVLRHRIERMEG